jgi:hypothetical protein
LTEVEAFFFGEAVAHIERGVRNILKMAEAHGALYEALISSGP